MSDDNPYEALGLDPSSSVEELTAELRRRIERASPEERQRIQKAWRQLTLKDEERVRLGFVTPPRADAGIDPLAKLREAVPPFISRRPAPPLVARVADAIAGPSRTTTSPRPPDPWNRHSGDRHSGDQHSGDRE